MRKSFLSTLDPMDLMDPVVYQAPPNPIYIPKKHTKMSYAKQNRIAKRKKKKY